MSFGMIVIHVTVRGAERSAEILISVVLVVLLGRPSKRPGAVLHLSSAVLVDLEPQVVDRTWAAESRSKVALAARPLEWPTPTT